MARNNAKRLLQIVELRRVQSQAAEFEARKSALALRQAQSRTQEATTAVQSAQDGWLRSVNDRHLGASLNGLWAIAISRGEAELSQRTALEAQAAQAKAQASGVWQMTLSRRDAAQSLWRQALKADVHRRTEIVLQDAVDRFSHRRGGQ